MTTADRNDLIPPQDKLEWVTPKISLMDAGDTDGSNGKLQYGNQEGGPVPPSNAYFNPS